MWKADPFFAEVMVHAGAKPGCTVQISECSFSYHDIQKVEVRFLEQHPEEQIKRKIAEWAREHNATKFVVSGASASMYMKKGRKSLLGIAKSLGDAIVTEQNKQYGTLLK